MHSFVKFTKMVMRTGSAQHPTAHNTVAVASLMYPPQLAWYPDNGRQPPNYLNQMEKIDWLNQEIHEVNVENRVPEYPRFHTFGVRKATRKSVDRFGHVTFTSVKSHRWEHWRETDPTRMLHLSNVRRFKMGGAVNKYFILRT